MCAWSLAGRAGSPEAEEDRRVTAAPKETHDMTSSLSRREFLYHTGAAGLGLATAGLSRASAQSNSRLRVLSIGVIGTIIWRVRKIWKNPDADPDAEAEPEPEAEEGKAGDADKAPPPNSRRSASKGRGQPIGSLQAS